jgi:hypothetical protein
MEPRRARWAHIRRSVAPALVGVTVLLVAIPLSCQRGLRCATDGTAAIAMEAVTDHLRMLSTVSARHRTWRHPPGAAVRGSARLQPRAAARLGIKATTSEADETARDPEAVTTISNMVGLSQHVGFLVGWVTRRAPPGSAGFLLIRRLFPSAVAKPFRNGTGLALFEGMVRIQKIVESATETTLSVEGRIVSEWVAVLERVCRQARRNTPRVQLDLAAVTFIDTRGVEVLRRLVTEGVAIVNCREFIDALLTGD